MKRINKRIVLFTSVLLLLLLLTACGFVSYVEYKSDEATVSIDEALEKNILPTLNCFQMRAIIKMQRKEFT